MPRIAIHYFTGTGNTAHAAGVLKQEFVSKGYDVQLIHVEKNIRPLDAAADLNIFMYPVYALTVPYPMQRYLRKLPKVSSAPAVVIANHGMASTRGGVDTGFESVAPVVASGILKRRGYRVVHTDAVGYTENLTPIANPPTAEEIRQIMEAGDKNLRRIASGLIRRDYSIKKYNILDHTLGRLFGFVFIRFGQWQLGKLYVADKDCNGCGVCVKNCPASAIRTLGGKPRWNYNCVGCLKCFNSCPKNALQMSIARLIFVFGLTIGLIPVVYSNYSILSGILEKVFPFAGSLSGFQAAGGVLAYLAAYILLFYVLDKVLFLLEKIPFLSFLISWNFTKKHGRYIAPGTKAD